MNRRQKKNIKKKCLHWICRGIRGNYVEVRWLLADCNPNLVFLQETFLKDSDISFKRYEIYNKTTTLAIGNRSTGSSSLLVKRTTFHEALQLKYKPSSHNCKNHSQPYITICLLYSFILLFIQYKVFAIQCRGLLNIYISTLEIQIMTSWDRQVNWSTCHLFPIVKRS